MAVAGRPSEGRRAWRGCVAGRRSRGPEVNPAGRRRQRRTAPSTRPVRRARPGPAKRCPRPAPANQIGSGTAYLTANKLRARPREREYRSGIHPRVLDVGQQADVRHCACDLTVVRDPALQRAERVYRLVHHHGVAPAAPRPAPRRWRSPGRDQRRRPRRRPALRRPSARRPASLGRRKRVVLTGVAGGSEHGDAAVGHQAHQGLVTVASSMPPFGGERRDRDGDHRTQPVAQFATSNPPVSTPVSGLVLWYTNGHVADRERPQAPSLPALGRAHEPD